MKIEIRRAELTERQIVRNLMELYQHDFSMTMFPAKWEVCVIEENPAARIFWETLINTTWPGRHQLAILDNEQWQGPVFSVDTHVTAPLV